MKNSKNLSITDKLIAEGVILHDEYDINKAHRMIQEGGLYTKVSCECQDVLNYALRGKCDIKIEGKEYSPALLSNINKIPYDECECGGYFYKTSNSIICNKCGCTHNDCI